MLDTIIQFAQQSPIHLFITIAIALVVVNFAKNMIIRRARNRVRQYIIAAVILPAIATYVLPMIGS